MVVGEFGAATSYHIWFLEIAVPDPRDYGSVTRSPSSSVRRQSRQASQLDDQWHGYKNAYQQKPQHTQVSFASFPALAPRSYESLMIKFVKHQFGSLGTVTSIF